MKLSEFVLVSRLLHDVPLLVLTCHCAVGVGEPLVTAGIEMFDPAITVELAGALPLRLEFVPL